MILIAFHASSKQNSKYCIQPARIRSLAGFTSSTASNWLTAFLRSLRTQRSLIQYLRGLHGAFSKSWRRAIQVNPVNPVKRRKLFQRVLDRIEIAQRERFAPKHADVEIRSYARPTPYA